MNRRQMILAPSSTGKSWWILHHVPRRKKFVDGDHLPGMIWPDQKNWHLDPKLGPKTYKEHNDVQIQYADQHPGTVLLFNTDLRYLRGWDDVLLVLPPIAEQRRTFNLRRTESPDRYPFKWEDIEGNRRHFEEWADFMNFPTYKTIDDAADALPDGSR